MNNVSQILALVLATAALLLSACAKKPVRPDPAATTTGPATSGTTVTPEPVKVPSEQAPGTTLTARTLPEGAIEDENTIRGLLQPVYFDFDRSAVTAKERQEKIDAAVKWLKDNADKRMLLEGHCDWRGTAEYNLGLGDRRATAVQKYLESLGVDSKRLETLSKGSADAKQTGTDADWAKDRRVDFVILKK